jgi:hypothetical protein
MIISRSLYLGFIAFVVALLVGTVVEKSQMHKTTAQPPTSNTVTVVDVARGVDAGQVATLVRLQPDERVVAVDDQRVDNDFAAGAAMAAHDLGTGKYLDLTVSGTRGARRVLVLMH